MSLVQSSGRKIVVVGPDLEPIARGAFHDAALDVLTADAFIALRGGRPADLVLVDAESIPAASLIAVLEQLARDPAAPVTILSGGAPATDVIRALLRLPKSDMLAAPYSAADLAVAAGRLLAPQTSQTQGRCWAVTSAVGGAGATTVAIELASAVSRLQVHRPRICIVDLNFADGAVAAYLGVASNMIVSSASFAAERMDPSLVDIFTSKPNPHLDVLAAPRNPRGFHGVAPEAVLALLDVVAGSYDAVILDLPRHRQPWSLEALSGCDEVLVVSELTVPALLSARALIEELESELLDGPRPRVVLNRLASRMFGPAPTLTEAERALGRPTDGAISSDWEAAAASVNLGGPISQHRPRSKIVRDIEILAKGLMAAPPRTQQDRAA